MVDAASFDTPVNLEVVDGTHIIEVPAEVEA